MRCDDNRIVCSGVWMLFNEMLHLMSCIAVSQSVKISQALRASLLLTVCCRFLFYIILGVDYLKYVRYVCFRFAAATNPQLNFARASLFIAGHSFVWGLLNVLQCRAIRAVWQHTHTYTYTLPPPPPPHTHNDGALTR